MRAERWGSSLPDGGQPGGTIEKDKHSQCQCSVTTDKQGCSNFTGSSRDAARLQLATIISEFAADGDCNLLELKCRAIGAMHLPRAA